MMRAALFCALFCTLMSACGVEESDPCPSSTSLRDWQSMGAPVALSGCDRIAELSSPANTNVSIWGSVPAAKGAAIRMSARLDILSGAGRFTVFAGAPTGAIVTSRESGVLSVDGVAGDVGNAGVSVSALADPDKSMRWRVSDVRIEASL